MQESRNTTNGFAARTRTNLQLAMASYCERQDFHMVTQVVNSFVGIVMVPWVRDPQAAFLSVSLCELANAGLPKWSPVTEGSAPQDLKELLRRLRNSISHGNFRFCGDPDARELEKVWILVADGPIDTVSWRASMRGDDLYKFCVMLAERIDAATPEQT